MIRWFKALVSGSYSLTVDDESRAENMARLVIQQRRQELLNYIVANLRLAALQGESSIVIDMTAIDEEVLEALRDANYFIAEAEDYSDAVPKYRISCEHLIY